MRTESSGSSANFVKVLNQGIPQNMQSSPAASKRRCVPSGNSSKLEKMRASIMGYCSFCGEQNQQRLQGIGSCPAATPRRTHESRNLVPENGSDQEFPANRAARLRAICLPGQGPVFERAGIVLG